MVRHGHTALNKGGPGGAERIRGWADVPLSSQGKSEAHKLAKELRLTPLSAVVTTDLQRGVYVAESIAEPRGMKIFKSREARPWDLGDLTGKPVTEAIPALQILSTGKGRDIPAGGSGESFNQFVNRWARFLMALEKKAAGLKAPLLVVTHTRNLQVTKAIVTKDPKYLDWGNHETPPGHYVRLIQDPAGKWELAKGN